ncbi:MAG: hypothetical protein AAGG51_09325 [Cyanobacteria bacterium P01_G01_bin.54]
MQENMIEASMRTQKRAYLSISDWQAIELAMLNQDIDVNFLMANLVISWGSDAVWAIEDRLDWLIQELLLQAPIALLSDSDYCFGNWEYQNTISLSLSDETVGFRNGQAQVVYFPKQPLIRSQLERATQMIELLQRIHLYQPIQNIAIIPHLQKLWTDGQQLYTARYEP